MISANAKKLRKIKRDGHFDGANQSFLGADGQPIERLEHFKQEALRGRGDFKMTLEKDVTKEDTGYAHKVKTMIEDVDERDRLAERKRRKEKKLKRKERERGVKHEDEADAGLQLASEGE